MKYFRVLFFLILYLPLNVSGENPSFVIYEHYGDFLEKVLEEIASGKNATYALPNNLSFLPSDEAELLSAVAVDISEAVIEHAQIANPLVNCPGAGFTEQAPYLTLNYISYPSIGKFYIKSEAFWLGPDGICKRKVVDGAVNLD